MKKNILLSLAFMAFCVVASAQHFKPDASYYGVGFWTPDTLGNHRAMVFVDSLPDRFSAVKVEIPWRRHDSDIEKKGIIVIDAATGEVVDEMWSLKLSDEKGEIAFRPKTVPGRYYVYYMPYRTSGGPYPKIKYDANPSIPSARSGLSDLLSARFEGFQSLSDFDSFYPMEVAATATEKKNLEMANLGRNFLLFSEHREYPIKMSETIPYRWAVQGPCHPFYAEADLNEYFVYQLGVWALRTPIENVKVNFTSLKGAKAEIPASAMTCFNTEGNDWLQRPMDIVLDVPQGKIQPLWIGIQIPDNIPMGLYSGIVEVTAAGEKPQQIPVTLKVSDYVLQDKGDDSPSRLSRLRWLNSSYAINEQLVKPFTPLQRDGSEISCLGRTIVLSENGFPREIRSYFSEEMTHLKTQPTHILAKPIDFVIEQRHKVLKWKNLSFTINHLSDGAAGWVSKNKVGNLDVTVNGTMEFDGFMEYHVVVKALKNTQLSDMRMEIPMNSSIARYALGLGSEGGYVPDSFDWKWDVAKAQEGFWIGSVNAGIHAVFRSPDYVRPLNTNFYQSKPLIIPECWNNSGKGGMRLRCNGESFIANTYSGERILKAGEEMTFIVLLSVTPFKTIDTEKQWTDRYYHAYRDIDEIKEIGANTINIHHAQPINPFINYPFLRPDYMKQYIDEAHDKGCKVKIYYTVRELANRAPELWALRSLGHEVFSQGPGGGYSWLQEHLQSDYIGAWFVDKYKDAAIVNSGVSRWHNYYVEGLNWLVKNVGIDGLYIDDLAIDRTTMKRVRKVLEQYKDEPRIDLHSANQFNQRDGFTNSAFLYMEHMPYLDRIWFGEYFKYEKGPEYWMTEVSGIPFGVMGEMLQNDGNPWRGMLYGMTAREHYHGRNKTVIPGYLWRVWDDFGIKGSRMIGYWVSYNPVKTDNKDVLATIFVRENKVMVAVASWASEDVAVRLNIDWKALGLDKEHITMTAPEIEGFQKAAQISVNESFIVPKDKGYIFIIQ